MADKLQVFLEKMTKSKKVIPSPFSLELCTAILQRQQIGDQSELTDSTYQ